MPLKYKRPWSEVPIHKVLTEEIHLWHCRNMNLYFFRSFSLAQVIYCPFGGASAQFQSCQHYWLSLRNNNKNSIVKWPQHSVEKKNRINFSNYIHANKSVECQDPLHKVTTNLFTSNVNQMLNVETKCSKLWNCFSINYGFFPSWVRKDMERQRQL